MSERIAFLIIGNMESGDEYLCRLLGSWEGVDCSLNLSSLRRLPEKLSEHLIYGESDALAVGARLILEPRSYEPEVLEAISRCVDAGVRVVHLQRSYEPTLGSLLVDELESDDLPLQTEQQLLLSLYKHDVWIRRLKQDREHFLELFQEHIGECFGEILAFLGLSPDLNRLRPLLSSYDPLLEAPAQPSDVPFEPGLQQKVRLYEDRRLLLNYARFFTDECRTNLDLEEEESGYPFRFQSPVDPYKLQVLILVDVLMEVEHLRQYLGDPLPGKPPTTSVVIFSHFQYVRDVLTDAQCLAHLESGRLKLWHAGDWKQCVAREYENPRSALIHSSKVLAPKGHLLAMEVEQHFDESYRGFVEGVKSAFNSAEDYYSSPEFAMRLAKIVKGEKPRILVEQACFSVAVKHFSRNCAQCFRDAGYDVYIHEPCRPDRIDYVVANTIEIAEFKPDIVLRNPNGYGYAPYKVIGGLPTIIPIHDLEAHPGFVDFVRQHPLGPLDMVSYTQHRFAQAFEEAGVSKDQLYCEYLPAEAELEPDWLGFPEFEIGLVKTVSPAIDLLGRIYPGDQKHYVNLSEKKIIGQVETWVNERIKAGDGLDFSYCNSLAAEHDWKHALTSFCHEQHCLRFVNALHHHSFKMALAGMNWDRLPHLRKYAQGHVAGRQDYQRHFKSCAINLSLNPWDEYHPRVFDGGRMGAFFLIYRVPDEVRWRAPPDYLEAGEHFDYFSSPEELVEKCRYYLDRPEERRRMGNNLKRVVDGRHTYEQTCETMINRFRQIAGARALSLTSR